MKKRVERPNNKKPYFNFTNYLLLINNYQLMFKNRLDAAKQLAEKINHDNIQPTKIISLSKNSKKIAQYLKKLLSAGQKAHQPLAEIILIVDDGSASLDKLKHAVKIYRKKKAKKVIIGLPVYKHKNIRKLEEIADAVYTVHEPKTFISPEAFYASLE